MEREEAVKKIREMTGPGGVAGEDAQQQRGRFYVGLRHMGSWVWFGRGDSWEDALKNCKELRPKHAGA